MSCCDLWDLISTRQFPKEGNTKLCVWKEDVAFWLSPNTSITL